MGDNELEKDLDKVRNDLTSLRDEVRLKLHLASMDTKDSFEQLEPRVRRFVQDLEKAGTSARDELRKTGTRLRDELVGLRDRLRKAAEGKK